MADTTIIIPARNVAETIEETLRSVLASKRVREVIVVNDGSSDDTVARVTRFEDGRIRLIPGPCIGIAGALNVGIHAATSPYVSRCDGDDLLVPEAYDRLADFLDANPDFMAVSSGYSSMSENGRHLADLACHRPAGEVTDVLRYGQKVTSFCTWLTRREGLLRAGGAREFFEIAEDIDLQYRLACQGRIWHEPTITYFYRLHASSITHVQPHAKAVFFENAARAFVKQRVLTGTDDLEEGNPPIYSVSKTTNERPLSKQVAGHLTRQAWRDFKNGTGYAGLTRHMLAVRHDPLDRETLRSFCALFVKASIRSLQGAPIQKAIARKEPDLRAANHKTHFGKPVQVTVAAQRSALDEAKLLATSRKPIIIGRGETDTTGADA